MADDDGVMYSVAADYELDVGNLVVFHGRGPPASSAMTLFFSHLSRLLEKAYLVLLIDLCACVRVFFFLLNGVCMPAISRVLQQFWDEYRCVLSGLSIRNHNYSCSRAFRGVSIFVSRL